MFSSLGMPEMIILMLMAVILFGKRLPEVAKSLGKGVVEFKKGLKGFETDLDASSYTPPERYDDRRWSDHVESTVPKFEPPTSAPVPRQLDAPQLDAPQPPQD
jgi:sec-independent protein translocase protein TatA